MTEFELMNQYKGTKDPQEHIFYVRGARQSQEIFLAHNGFIGLSIPWIWYLEVGTSRKRREGKQETGRK
jgi:hypothetical protein